MRAALAAIGCALALLAVSPLPHAQRTAGPNVLLITLDTMRADRIGAYGYKLAATPHLDRLAREGVLFADATTQSPLTAPAHVALLTGQYPTRLGVRDNASTPLPDATLTIAEAYKEAGYRTGAFIGAFVLDRPYGFAQGFEVYDATFQGFRSETKQQAQRIADDVVAAANAWLKSIQPGSPFFAWVHLYDAHSPYSAPAPFGAKFSTRPYDGEIAYVDMAVGKLLATVSASGVMDRTVVAVIGDHGEALGDHGEDEHGMFLYEAVLRIPWILRLPASERAGSVIAEQVRAIDLAPTLLDLAGVRPPVRFDGESLAPVIRGSGRRHPPVSYADAHFPELHFGWSMLRSTRDGTWKYIDAPKAELYDLRTDRAERRNVLTERAAIATGLAADMDRTVRSFGRAATAAPPQPDPETLARLRSLGYVGIAAPSGRAGRGPDPKDKVQEWKLFRTALSRAIDDLTKGRTDSAIDRLKRAVAINERAYDVHALLGDAWRQKGEHEKALLEYDAAALLNPTIAAPHLSAAESYLAQGKLSEAISRLETAARLEPGSGELALLRGRVYERAGRGPEAMAEYQRAIAMIPSNAGARARLVNVAMNLRRFDVAEPQLKVLLELNHEPARTRYTLGAIAEARGDHVGAAAEYRRALAADPTLKPAREALTRVTQR